MTNAVKTWSRFAREVRVQGCHLLKRLDDFPGAILVTGCQRSGTTAVARLITTSDGMVNYWFGKDDELDAALILSGKVNHEPIGRYCFQTTYLNECYGEYFQHGRDYKIVWILRNPYSVIYSMMNNWGRFAFKELFASCGLPYLSEQESKRYRIAGQWAIPRVRRACLSYVGKVSQLFELKAHFDTTRLIAVDYDDLVLNKDRMLPYIYEFLTLQYRSEYKAKIHHRNLNKAQKLSEKQRNTIEKLCISTYEKAKGHIIRV